MARSDSQSEYTSSPWKPTLAAGSRPELYRRSHRQKSTTSSFAHIQVGHRSNAPSAARGSSGASASPRTLRSTRAQSGQSPSTATNAKPSSAISRWVRFARHW